MAFVIADRVRESSVSTGTGNFTLAGAVTGYQTFASVMATSDTTYYTIADQGGANWEVGIGTFTSPSTLARTTILSSSNGGSVVTFTSGTKDVFISLPASKTNTVEAGNLTFASTAQRITGDFSTTTLSNRVAFQSTTLNGQTILPVIPNGSSVVAGFSAVSSATDPNNCSEAVWAIIGASEARLNSSIRGTGTYLPMTFYTNGAEKMRLDTSGNVGIGTSSPGALLQLNKGSGAADFRLSVAGTLYGNIYASSSDMTINSVTAIPLTFGTNNTERARIDTSGNVGIGTTTLGSKLTVNGDVAGTFFVNPTTVSANYTIPTNYNAMTAGPITVASGAVVTVGSGSTWVIV